MGGELSETTDTESISFKTGAFASASVARFSAVHWVRLRHSLPPADATASIFKGDTFAGDFVHLSN